MAQTVHSLEQLNTHGRVPPQNLEAEQSLLGAMLLSKDAIGMAIEEVTADDFYRGLHGRIFEAIINLYGKGEPVDAVTLSEELRKSNSLEQLGGLSYLRALTADTPSTSNAGYYAEIVRQCAMMRRLIEVSSEISEKAYQPGVDPSEVLDDAEGLVFNISQERRSSQFSHLRELLDDSLRSLEQMQLRGTEITGLSTGFRDFDRLTAGLQPSNLMIVAARPGMGKSCFIANIATHAALEQHKAVAFFTLEMSKMEIVNRLLCAESKVEAQKIKTGALGDQDWSRIAHTVGVLSNAPLYIDDSAYTSVLDIRAKCRRLAASQPLGLIIVDYLQLMHGSGRPESRQVEIAEISRNLKTLARELSTPIIAACQLNRSPESRSDKRPMLGDLRESGCMPANTRLLRADNGKEVTLGELVLSQEQPLVWSLDERWRIVPRRLVRTFPSGIKPVFRLRLASGYEVEATANHPFRRLDGWTRLDELNVGDAIASIDDPAMVDLATSDVHWDEVKEIESLGPMPTFDATVEGTHNFVANGVIAHNSIEQDADIVAFLYRDDYYHGAESTERGEAELIIAKHRNGPTDTIRLAFLEHLSKFEDFTTRQPA